MGSDGYKIKLTHPELGTKVVSCPRSIEPLLRDYLDRPWHLVAWGILEAEPPWAVASGFCAELEHYVHTSIHDLPMDSERLGEKTFRVGQVHVELQ